MHTRYIDIPEGVTVTIKARDVTVEGSRGKLQKAFKSRSMDFTTISDRRIRVDLWGGSKKEVACVRSTTAHIENMIKGVTKGFRYKMRFVYAHFPINATIIDNKKIEIRNFLGEKRVREITMLDGCTITKSTDVKDQIVIEGNDLSKVSLSCAQISDQAKVRNKDIRKFLDGIYVSEKGHIEQDE